jgi:hypothetical protein
MKTHEEMHEMSLTELKDYIQDVWSHLYDAQAIKEYRSKIGEPRLLVKPTEVEFEEEEEEIVHPTTCDCCETEEDALKLLFKEEEE